MNTSDRSASTGAGARRSVTKAGTAVFALGEDILEAVKCSEFVELVRPFHQSRSQRLARKVVNSRGFTFVVASAILINAAMVGVETGLWSRAGSGSSHAGWYAVEVAFTLGFLVELCLRVAAEGCREFLGDGWNVIDLILVGLGCLDTLFFSHLSQDDGDFDWVASVRIARLARIIRLLRFFRELWMLVAGILNAARTLLWAWTLMTLVLYVAGIFVTRWIGQPHGDDPDISAYFGTVPSSMFTLFQVMTTEEWSVVARKTMKKELAPAVAAFFVLFLYATTFAIMNVVVAVIVENTMERAGGEKEERLVEAEKEQRKACASVYEVFCAADADKSGTLTQQEFLEALERPDVMRLLRSVGIDARQAENLFAVLDYDESGSLDAREFVGGVVRAMGDAQAKDVLAGQCDLWRSERRIRGQLGELASATRDRLNKVGEHVAELERISGLLRRSAGA